MGPETGVLVAVAGLLVYRAVPDDFRRVDNVRGLVMSIVLAALCGTVLCLVAYANGYTLERLGVGTGHLGLTSAAVLISTSVGICGLWIFAKKRHAKPGLSINMLKLSAAYIPWAYIQQMIGISLLANFLRDSFGDMLAILIGGILCGLVHTKDVAYFIFTMLVGATNISIFLVWPNLIPLAVSHAILGTAHFYWVQQQDKWKELFG